jgi:Replication-relaxation
MQGETVNLFSMKRKRRPSLKRAEQGNVPGFRLTARDGRIIWAVHEYRALTAPQIASLFFPSTNGEGAVVNARCKYRLRMLYDHRYLHRDEQPQKLTEGRKPLVYFLDVMGAEFLSHELGKEIHWDPQHNDVTYPFLEHLLATNDVRAAIAVGAASNGWQVRTWIDDKALKSAQQKEHVTLRGNEGATQQAAVVPDGYFVVDAGEFLYHHFLEVDMRTVTGEATKWGRRDWARKVRAYLEYYRSGKYEARYGTKSLRILTVTTGERRLSNLKAITTKVGGRKRFWFTTFDLATSARILTEPIWQVAGEDTPQRLIL